MQANVQLLETNPDGTGTTFKPEDLTALLGQARNHAEEIRMLLEQERQAEWEALVQRVALSMA